MDLLKLLDSAGGEAGIRKLAGQLGMSSAGDAQKLIAALAPALTGGLQKQAASAEGLAGLQRALASGGHERYLKNPDLLEQPETREDGNRILGHLFGSKDVSRNVAASAAEQTGFDTGLIKKALPLIASLAMGAMGRATNEKSSADSASGLSVLAGLLGGGGGKGSPLGDMIGLARKFF
ncbi:MAG: DUF937 domain-containing protein [Halioglobus sp.]|nr:DUF937 domain-containing protein [Halioglobus sp.]